MYTYAFFQNPTAPLDLPDGIAGKLEILHQGEIAALVEPDLAIESLQTDEARLLEAIVTHDRVIVALFQQVTVLPLRFGTQFVSAAALLDHLTTQQTYYRERLAQLSGKAEYTLKLTALALPETTIPAHLKGKDYFLAKKQQYQTQVDWQQQQQQELRSLIGAIRQTYPQTLLSEFQEDEGKVYLLVDRPQAAKLAERLEFWQAESPCWQLLLGEAVPPYHFV